MASQKPTLEVVIAGDTTQVQKALGQTGAAADKMAKDVTSSAQRTGTALGGLDRSAGQMSEGVRRSGEQVERLREGFDEAERRALGFRDGITGVQDSMSGFSALARGEFSTGLLFAGQGVADLSSTFANALLPSIKNTIAQIGIMRLALAGVGLAGLGVAGWAIWNFGLRAAAARTNVGELAAETERLLKQGQLSTEWQRRFSALDPNAIVRFGGQAAISGAASSVLGLGVSGLADRSATWAWATRQSSADLALTAQLRASAARRGAWLADMTYAQARTAFQEGLITAGEFQAFGDRLVAADLGMARLRQAGAWPPTMSTEQAFAAYQEAAARAASPGAAARVNFVPWKASDFVNIPEDAYKVGYARQYGASAENAAANTAYQKYLAIQRANLMASEQAPFLREVAALQAEYEAALAAQGAATRRAMLGSLAAAGLRGLNLAAGAATVFEGLKAWDPLGGGAKMWAVNGGPDAAALQRDREMQFRKAALLSQQSMWNLLFNTPSDVKGGFFRSDNSSSVLGDIGWNFSGRSEAKALYQEMDTGLISLLDSGQNISQVFAQLSDSIGDGNVQFALANDLLPQFKDRLDKARAGGDLFSATLEQQIKDMKEWDDRLRRSTDPVYAAYAAERDLSDAKKDTADALKEFGRKSPEYKDALMGQLQAAQDLHAAQIDLSQVNRGEATEAIKGLAAEYGLATDAVNLFLQQVSMIPTTVEEAQRLKIRIDLPTNYGAGTPTTVAGQVTAWSMLRRHHSGVIVPGPRGTEVAAILQAGERVTSLGGDTSTAPIMVSGSALMARLVEELSEELRGRGMQLVATGV